jgi:hypothetical protein
MVLNNNVELRSMQMTYNFRKKEKEALAIFYFADI